MPGWCSFSAFLFVFAFFIAYLFVVFFSSFLSPYLPFKSFSLHILLSSVSFGMSSLLIFSACASYLSSLFVFPFKSFRLYVLSSISVSISTFQVFKFVCLPFQVFMSVCLSFEVFPSVYPVKYLCLNIFLSSLSVCVSYLSSLSV